MNGFELAGRAMKVGHVTDRTDGTLGGMGGQGGKNHFILLINSNLHKNHSMTNYETAQFIYKNILLDLDSEQLDKTGIDLGATGRLALMAKLAQGTGMQLPQAANQALNSAVMQVIFIASFILNLYLY